MFAPRYFTPRAFAPRYFPPAAGGVTPQPPPPPLIGGRPHRYIYPEPPDTLVGTGIIAIPPISMSGSGVVIEPEEWLLGLPDEAMAEV